MAKKTGIELEIEVSEFLEGSIASGEEGLNPSLAKVRRRAGYYSEARKSDIIMDVSVEVFRKGSDTPFLIWVWECKDYSPSHKVGVEEIEEFHSKLEQIGADKTKGTVVTRSTSQEGCLNYAKSKGIGLARFLPPGSMIRLVENERSIKSIAPKGLLSNDPKELESAFFAQSTAGEYATNLRDYVRLELAGHEP